MKRRVIEPPVLGGEVCVVLVRPRYAENVGAAARALENAGAGELRLVAPNEAAREQIAQRVARGGEPRLLAAPTFETLEEAIADADLALATSWKTGRRRRPLLPWEVSRSLLPRLRPRRTALVFGPEDHGLTREEVDACHHLVTIPSHGPLNLAQSVVVLLYEIKMRNPAEAVPEAAPPPTGDVPRIVDAASKALARLGYPRHRKPLQHEMARLADILSRTPLARWEVNFLIGMFRHVELNAEERASS
jgi:TrmH family RNA methyltransferase